MHTFFLDLKLTANAVLA